MIQLPMVLQAYTPQLHLGDWQIVVFVNRRRNRISVERWHSSEKNGHPMEGSGEILRINTGIRAFRRQMPVLASAMEEIHIGGMAGEQIVEAVFEMLAKVYEAVPEQDLVCIGDERLLHYEFADFLQDRKQEALAGLAKMEHSAVKH